MSLIQIGRKENNLRTFTQLDWFGRRRRDCPSSLPSNNNLMIHSFIDLRCSGGNGFNLLTAFRALWGTWIDLLIHSFIDLGCSGGNGFNLLTGFCALWGTRIDVCLHGTLQELLIAPCRNISRLSWALT